MIRRDEFEQTYSKCGAVFRVDFLRQAEYEESEEYFCSECLCMYKTRAASTPHVTLISKRSKRINGENDKYKNSYE